MILYADTKSFLSYKLKTAEDFTYPRSEIARGFMELERGDSLLEWGMKLFRMGDARCLHLVNLGAGLTLYLFGVERPQIGLLGRVMEYYIRRLHEGDGEMTSALDRMFSRVKVCQFAHLTDEFTAAGMEQTEQEFIFSGKWLPDCVKDGSLDGCEVNRRANFEYAPDAGKRFRDAVVMRFRE